MPPSQLPPFSQYSDDDVVAFYMGGDLSGADAEVIIEGRALPVHLTAVLAPQSGVLQAVLDDRHHGGATDGSGRPTPWAGAPNGHLIDPATQLEVVMSDTLVLAREEQSLQGFTLKRVAHFLRFAYNPDEVAALDFELPGAGKTLSACARLAHRLDMPALLDRLDARMEEAVGTHDPTLQRLMDWSTVAEECGLRRLWTKCVHQIAMTLARTREGGCTHRTTSCRNLQSKAAAQALLKVPPSAVLTKGADAAATAAHDAALLQSMSPKAQLAVMAALLVGIRKAGGNPDDLVPSEANLGGGISGIWKLPSPPETPLREVA